MESIANNKKKPIPVNYDINGVYEFVEISLSVDQY